MSIARPDTSRRREPQGPGRRFGPCKKSRNTRSPLAFIACLAAGLATLASLPAMADEDTGPVVLTNADVARLHAKPSQPDDAARHDAGQTAAPAAVGAARVEDDLTEALALEADLRARLDRISRESMGSVEQSIDDRISNASQLRLRASAPSSSPPATAPAAPMPGGAHADTDTDADDADERTANPEPACMYGTRGRLLFEPEGRSCAPVRASSQRTFESGASEAKSAHKHGSVGCVYGSRGQLLYSSRGVECPKVEGDQ